MHSYNEILAQLGKEPLPLEVLTELEKFFKTTHAATQLDSLIRIYELTKDLTIKDKKTQSVINYLKNESENIIRGMLDAKGLSEFELQNLLEQRKNKRDTDYEYMPVVKPTGIALPRFGESEQTFATREAQTVEDHTKTGVYKTLLKYFQSETFGSVKYLRSQEERDQFRVFMSDGQLWSLKTTNLNEGANNWADKRVNFSLYDSPNLDGIDPSMSFKYSVIYVIDPRGNMYVNRGMINEFHHSSFLAGGPILFAGEIEIRNGRLQHIDNSSGHYRPTEMQMSGALRYLNAKGQIYDNTNIKVLLPQNNYKGELLDHDKIDELRDVSSVSAKDPLYDLIILKESMISARDRINNESIRIQEKHQNKDPRLQFLAETYDNLNKNLASLDEDINTLKNTENTENHIFDLNVKHYNIYAKELSSLIIKLDSVSKPNKIKRFLIATQDWAISKLSNMLSKKISKNEKQTKTTKLVTSFLDKIEEGQKIYSSPRTIPIAPFQQGPSIPLTSSSSSKSTSPVAEIPKNENKAPSLLWSAPGSHALSHAKISPSSEELLRTRAILANCITLLDNGKIDLSIKDSLNYQKSKRALRNLAVEVNTIRVVDSKKLSSLNVNLNDTIQKIEKTNLQKDSKEQILAELNKFREIINPVGSNVEHRTLKL